MDTRRMPTADYLDQYRGDVEDFNRGDLSRFGERFDENLVVHTVPGWPEEVFVGAPSYLNFVRQLLDPVDARIEIKELRQIGEVVAAQVVLKVRGHDTALEQEREYAQLIFHHRGKQVLILFFDDFASALATVGEKHA